MLYKDENSKKYWNETLAKNTHFYGKEIIEYARRWAAMMELAINTGSISVSQAATDTNDKADTDEISGFMFNCAVKLLVDVWIHGDELSQWHNRNVSVSNPEEGVNANKSGKTS